MEMVEKKYYKWVLVALLWGVALLNFMDRQVLSTMRPAMQVDIHELQSATNFGYLMGIFLWVYGFMSPIAGIIADKFNKKWLIVGSVFVWSAVTFGIGLATTFHQVYWLRALMGISEALYIPTGFAMITEFHEEKSRSLAIGVQLTGVYFGQALGGFGGTFAAMFSWQATFHSFGIIGIAYSFILIVFLRQKKMKPLIRSSDKKVIKEKIPVIKVLALLFSNISFWAILFYFAVPSAPGWATKNWLPTLFAESLHIPMSKAGPISMIAIAISSLIGVLFGGILSDRWVQKNVRGRIYTSAIGLSMMIPALLLMGFGHNLVHVVGAALFFGVGWGMYDTNNMPILCQFVSSRHRATAYGIMNMVGVFSGAYITDILGRSFDAGHLGRDYAMLAGVVLMAIIVILSFLHPKVNDYKD